MAAIADRAHGVVSREELLAGGVTPVEITRRLEKGSLIREFRGVYRVGHRAPSTEARYMAAVKACGPGAVLSGLAAGYLLGLVRRRVPPRPEVTTSRDRRVKGVRVRRTRQIDARDATIFNRIPTTSVPRTLVDLAAYLSFAELARACHEARVRYGTGPSAVEEVLARRPTSPGAGKLRRVLRGDGKVTLSVLERRFLKLLSDNGLPLPETNKPVGRAYVDCRWRVPLLIVELDGYRYHSSRHAWEQDRRREREARARGEEFRRYTFGDVCESPELMLRELRALLAGKRAA